VSEFTVKSDYSLQVLHQSLASWLVCELRRSRLHWPRVFLLANCLVMLLLNVKWPLVTKCG